MERSGTESSEATIGSGSGYGWEEWNAVPRDGPAVFVVDVEVADREGRVQGRWIDPTGTREEIERQLGELLGRASDEGTWAVVDQVGLGPLMVPEVLAATDLPVAAQEAVAEGGR